VCCGVCCNDSVLYITPPSLLTVLFIKSKQQAAISLAGLRIVSSSCMIVGRGYTTAPYSPSMKPPSPEPYFTTTARTMRLRSAIAL
jgi:hypothetical protein